MRLSSAVSDDDRCEGGLNEAKEFQRQLPDDALMIVARRTDREVRGAWTRDLLGFYCQHVMLKQTE